jgi:hypothetical protein
MGQYLQTYAADLLAILKQMLQISSAIRRNSGVTSDDQPN